MAYKDDIAKKQTDAFAELYEFTVSTAVTRYTSHDEKVTFQSREYTPRPIKRSNYDNQEKLRSKSLKITAPIDDIMKQFVATAPVEPIKIKITRVILDVNQNFIEIFNGEVINVQIQDNSAVATCESGTEIFRNEFPRFVHHASCQWRLFDEGCTLLENNFKITATSITLSNGGKVITAAAISSQPNGWLTLGYVRFGNDARLITDHNGTSITIIAPFVGLKDGDTVNAFAGCDKKATTCISKFNNFVNFTGFRFIPSSNPVVWGFTR